VIAAFRGVVGRADFGVFDSFFRSGRQFAHGRATGLPAACPGGVDLPLRNLFERPTVAALAEAVDGLAWSAAVPSPGAHDREEIEL